MGKGQARSLIPNEAVVPCIVSSLLSPNKPASSCCIATNKGKARIWLRYRTDAGPQFAAGPVTGRYWPESESERWIFADCFSLLSEAANRPQPSSPPSYPDGVKVLHHCPDGTVDICFVHGLTGDRDATWTTNGQSEPWSKLLFPDELKTARIDRAALCSSTCPPASSQRLLSNQQRKYRFPIQE